MIKDVKYINQKSPIKEAAAKMMKFSIGSVLVEDDNGDMVGILTERDVLKHVAKGCACDDIVSKEMTKNVIAIEQEAEIVDAIDIMVKKKIKKLVVMHNERVVGIITASDILKSGDKIEDEVLLRLARYFPVQKSTGYAG
jgi:CBS domain-containing protein